MIAVIQRVSEAKVDIGATTVGEIGLGFMVLLGIGRGDQESDADWLCKKICNLRVFADEKGKMNCSLPDVAGDLLIISQFTLHANTKKGNRPSFVEAAPPAEAIPLYEYFIKTCEATLGKKVATGEFGADMQVSLCNDGPVTIILDTAHKK